MNLDATGIQIVLVLAAICFVLEAFRDRPVARLGAALVGARRGAVPVLAGRGLNPKPLDKQASVEHTVIDGAAKAPSSRRDIPDGPDLQAL